MASGNNGTEEVITHTSQGRRLLHAEPCGETGGLVTAADRRKLGLQSFLWLWRRGTGKVK